MATKVNWATKRLGDLAEFRNGVNYNKINATLDPRTFQVGIRFDF